MPRPGARTAHPTSLPGKRAPLCARRARGRARHRHPCAAPAEMRRGGQAPATAPGATAVPRPAQPAGPRAARGPRAAPVPQPGRPPCACHSACTRSPSRGRAAPHPPARPPAPRPPRIPRRPPGHALRRGGRCWGALHPLRVAPPRLRRGPAACGGPALAALARPPKRSGGRARVQHARRAAPKRAAGAGAPQAGGPSPPAARCAGRWRHPQPVLPPGMPPRPRPRKGAARRLRRVPPCVPASGAALHGVAAVAAHAQQGRAPPTG
jgi:hypothetical protein